MGLDIGISEKETVIYPQRDEPIVTLEDNGYFWFLYPFFEELAAETGKWIDLYEAPVFVGQELKALKGTISMARGLIRKKPNTWKVENFSVEKKEFLILLRKISQIIDLAIKTKRCVTFFGD